MFAPLINLLLVIFLFVFFYFLGKSANLIVKNTKQLGRKVGIDMYFLGLIIGLFTTLPELSIGVNSIINDIPELSFGNLFGGTIVLLGLVLGIDAILYKKIRTTGHGNNLIFIIFFLLTPIILGLDGLFGVIDGVILILLYLFIMYKMYKTEQDRPQLTKAVPSKKKIYMNIFWIITGITGLLVVSTLIVKTTELLLTEVGISSFVIGSIIFSVGTNLPEISICITSLKNHNKDLSYSSVLGSAAANPFIIGLLSFIQPLRFDVELSYLVMASFTILLLAALYYFYRTGNYFSRKEGYILIMIYSLFLIFELSSQAFR